MNVSWKDLNGNEHSMDTSIELDLQQPKCKYLLPCGICTLTIDNNTCHLLQGVKINDAKEEENT